MPLSNESVPVSPFSAARKRIKSEWEEFSDESDVESRSAALSFVSGESAGSGGDFRRFSATRTASRKTAWSGSVDKKQRNRPSKISIDNDREREISMYRRRISSVINRHTKAWKSREKRWEVIRECVRDRQIDYLIEWFLSEFADHHFCVLMKSLSTRMERREENRERRQQDVFSFAHPHPFFRREWTVSNIEPCSQFSTPERKNNTRVSVYLASAFCRTSWCSRRGRFNNLMRGLRQTWNSTSRNATARNIRSWTAWRWTKIVGHNRWLRNSRDRTRRNNITLRNGRDRRRR